MMRILLLSISCLFQGTVFAMDWPDVPEGSRLLIGTTTKSTDLYVQDPNNPFNVYGVLTEDNFSTYPMLSFYSPDHYFNNDGHFGWFIEINWQSFRLNRQSDPNNPDLPPADLGTLASGNFIHITPTLFYQWGERDIGRMGGQSFKFGIGLGIGYLSSRGNIVLTEVSGQPTHNFNVNGIDMSVTVMMEYRYNNWYVRALGGGPAITRNGYEYEIFDFAMDFGYIFTF